VTVVHPVEEALKAGKRKFDHVIVARERDDLRLEKLVPSAASLASACSRTSREQLTLRAQTRATRHCRHGKPWASCH